MASYLRPRRGKKATAIAQLNSSAPLKRGEVFFEVPDAGTGTGAGRIKMGDGSTAYESLPYFLEPFDPDSATVGFTDATAAESDPYATNATHTNAIVPSANLKTILTNLKQLLLNYNSQFTKLNNDLIDIDNSLDGVFIVQNTGKQYASAPAAGSTFVRVQIDIPDGYTLLGVIEANSSQSAVVPFAIKETSDTIMIRGRNVVNSVQETYLSAVYILIKSSFIN